MKSEPSSSAGRGRLELIGVYGRRRVGKAELLRRFGEGKAALVPARQAAIRRRMNPSR